MFLGRPFSKRSQLRRDISYQKVSHGVSAEIKSHNLEALSPASARGFDRAVVLQWLPCQWERGRKKEWGDRIPWCEDGQSVPRSNSSSCSSQKQAWRWISLVVILSVRQNQVKQEQNLVAFRKLSCVWQQVLIRGPPGLQVLFLLWLDTYKDFLHLHTMWFHYRYSLLGSSGPLFQWQYVWGTLVSGLIVGIVGSILALHGAYSGSISGILYSSPSPTKSKP